MDSAVVTSKALVQICVLNQNGPTVHQYTMDMMFEDDTFHCKFSTSAWLVNSDKKVSVYLVLDSSHVQHLEVCDNKTGAIPRASRVASSSEDFVIRQKTSWGCDSF